MAAECNEQMLSAEQTGIQRGSNLPKSLCHCFSCSHELFVKFLGCMHSCVNNLFFTTVSKPQKNSLKMFSYCKLNQVSFVNDPCLFKAHDQTWGSN